MKYKMVRSSAKKACSGCCFNQKYRDQSCMRKREAGIIPNCVKRINGKSYSYIFKTPKLYTKVTTGKRIKSCEGCCFYKDKKCKGKPFYLSSCFLTYKTKPTKYYIFKERT